MEVGRLPSQEAALREAHSAKRRPDSGGDPSRRGLLLMLGAAVGSGMVGYWWRGLGVVGAAGDGEAVPAVVPEGANEGGLDYRIIWARKMASDETPIEELLGNASTMVREVTMRSFNDILVWRGIERICEAIYQDPGVLAAEQRQVVPMLLASTIRSAYSPKSLDLERFLPTLDRLAR